MPPPDPAELPFLRLMRLARVCAALDVEPPVAELLCELSDRIAALERRLQG